MSYSAPTSLEVHFPKREALLFSLLLLLLSLFFYFKNLDDWFLWQDEANAALLARNTLDLGLPLVFDGKNAIWPNTTDVSPSFFYWILWGWFPIYMNALIFKLLGVSTFSARFSSALLATLFVQALYWILRRVSNTKALPECAALAILFCVPLSLFFRQCGYYATTVCFSFLLFASFFWTAPSKSRDGVFLGCSLILVNTHVMIWGIALLALALVALFSKESRTSHLGLLVWAGLLALPFLLLYEVWVLFERTGTGASSNAFLPYWDRLQYYLQSIHIVLLPAWYAGLLAGMAWCCRNTFSLWEKQTLFRALIFSAVGLLVVPFITRYLFFRYIVYLIPFLLLAAILIHVRFWHTHRKSASVAFVLAFLHFGLGLRNGPDGILFLLQQFSYELTHENEDVNEVLCNYLKQHAHPTDTVLCPYGDFTIQFYTPLVVRGGPGGMGVWNEKTFPEWGIPKLQKSDWIVLRKSWQYIYGNNFEEFFKEGRYEKISLPAADMPWGNRPDPFHHFFATPLLNEPGSEPLTIYHRVGEAKS